MKFIKMHGAGNDYVYIDGFKENVPSLKKIAVAISDRHKGIGSDGLVVILPSKKCDFKMRIFNKDGSEAQMCGNAIRCLGKYVYDYGYTKNLTITVETLAGVKKLELFAFNKKISKVRVDMGEPIIKTKYIPVICDEEKLINQTLEFTFGRCKLTAVSIGNPHVVIFNKKIENINIEAVGKEIEYHHMFPERTNVEFVQIISTENAKMRVWERGSGETQACGTGACASLVAGVLNGSLHRKATISLLGGDLEVEWNEKTNHLFMTGEAVYVFEGEVDISHIF